MGYVDGQATGWTELRVHGVAGTAPEAMLEHPNVVRVAGYAQAGFFRRLWEARSSAQDTAWHRTEAYSWGGLTSGDNTRALWLLLLPFMLLNVAYFTTPYPRAPDPGRATDGRSPARRLDRVAGSLLQVLALSFTATFALTAVTVAMDLVGWQCAAGRPPGGDMCLRSWLGWLVSAGLDRPGRQLAVTAVLPLALIGLLWLLGNATWLRLEKVDAVQTVPDDEVDVETPLEDRALWNGRAPVRRLRALHVAAGLAVPGVFALAPLPPGPSVLSPRHVVLGALLVLLAVTVVLASLRTTARRERPRYDGGQARRRQQTDERRGFYRWWPGTALVLTLCGLGVAWSTPVPRPVGGLPWLAGTVHWLFAAQGLALVVLAAVCARLRTYGRWPDPPPCATGTAVRVRPAWHGLAQPGFALLGWTLAGGFSAGVILRAAQTLGTPVAPGQTAADHPLVVATAYSWAAVAGLVLGLVALGRVGVTVWRLRRPSAQVQDEVAAAYDPGDGDARDGEPGDDGPGRRADIARAWHEAQTLSGEAQRALGFLLVATVVVVALGVVGFLVDDTGLLTDLPGVVTAANLGISGFVLVLVGVGRQAYRSAATRRTVGIAWDLGTFWPRAVHPLAPPCYAERAVPDLTLRMRYYAQHGRVLLSCHSQGSVLGAAVLMQVETAVSDRTAFLTYGSPLTRLYGGFFPAYFGPAARDRLGSFVGGTPGRPGTADRSTWRWRNLHRPSDPIGGPIFCAAPPVFPGDADPGADPGDVDRPLVDPVFARPPGDPCFPPVLGHSNYLADPVLVATARALQAGVPHSDVEV